MASPLSARLGAGCLVTWLLVPTFALAQVDVPELLGQGCSRHETVADAEVADARLCCARDACSPDAAPDAANELQDDEMCPPGCSDCPCCPGVSAAVGPPQVVVVACAASDRAVIELGDEVGRVDAERVFRPPRAGLG